MKKYAFNVTIVLITAMAVLSCMSVPKESDIPQDFTPADLSRRAQEAFDVHNYRAAYAYYEIIIKRFPDDAAACVAAEYEIAHLHIKKRKWQEAYELLKTILIKYETADGMYLPPQYYKLAKLDYERAAEALKIQ